jgi:sugar phosphate isomerase/epimerase
MPNMPKIYLAGNNCFASKRWTRPGEWMDVIRDMGVYYVEASADTECDPLYMTTDYLADWRNEIREHSSRTGVKVCNLYSGHGTYSTLGLAHTDSRVRRHILNDWLKPMVNLAGDLGAGLGFFCHAFSESVLQDPITYQMAYETLCNDLVELAAYATDQGLDYLGLEQMYSPHQAPWTVEGAEALIRQVYGKGGHPLYITIDTGHQSGQRRFLRPNREALGLILEETARTGRLAGWVGSLAAQQILLQAAKQGQDIEAALTAIEEDMDNYPHLFAREQDGDPYHWLEKLGRYSPILHLQQTDGTSSKHWGFTATKNQIGIIDPRQILKALAKSYREKEGQGMPPACENIYLTLELFSGTAESNYAIRERMAESVDYMRHFIPRDGLTLDMLLK